MRALLILLLITATGAGAQGSRPGATTTGTAGATVTSGAFFAVSAGSLATSEAWYTRVLGLRATTRFPGGPGPAVVILEGNGLIIELLAHSGASGRPERDTTTRPGFMKAGALVDDFAALLKHLRQEGADIAYGPFPANGGQRANVIIRDPDGNLLQFFQK